MLYGTVFKHDGVGVLGRATVVLFNSTNGKDIATAQTDTSGHFRFDVAPGFYAVRRIDGDGKAQIQFGFHPLTENDIEQVLGGQFSRDPLRSQLYEHFPLFADGSRPLYSNWDAGPHKITAKQLESDVADGTPPFIVASTTEVANLKAEDSGKLGGVADTGYAKLANANVFTADQSVADDTKFAFGSGSNAALGWSSASSELQLISDSDTLMFDAGATDVGFGWATSGQLDFKVGSNIEMSLTVNELTFNTGATDVALGWTSSGQLDFKIGSTNEMGLVSNKLSFFSGFSPAFLQWSTDGKLEFGVASGVEMDLTSSGLNIVDACRASMFRADTSSTGVAGTNTWGGTTLSANPLGTRPSIDRLPTGYLTAASAGWIKIHVGTTEAVIPYWTK